MDAPRTCALCPKLCRFACPVASASGDESATPTSMGTMILLRREGALAYAPDRTHPFYRCTGCLGCQVPCDFDIDVPAFLAPEKELAWQTSAAPPQVVAVADRVAGGGTPDDASAHHEVLDGPRFEGTGVVYWPGCALVGADPAAASATRGLLQDVIGETVHLPPVTSPACCGDPLAAAGDRSRMLGHRAGMIDALRGASRVVTGCACCLEWLPDGAEHVIDLLGIQWRGRVPGGAVAYHDPCRQARPDDLGGVPRALLAAATGEPVREFVDRGAETACCGAGDGHASFFPAEARATARWRLRDPAAVEAGVVVTACSRCTAHLSAAAPDGIAVRDLAVFLAGSDDGDR
jgi:Fe-S oxidoreductase